MKTPDKDNPNAPSLHHSKSYSPISYANFVVQGIAAKLATAGRDEGEIKARWLIHHVTGVPFGEIATKGIKPLIKEQWDALGAFLDRVVAGEPIQYVVGNADFMGHLFLCDRRALVPRPETELLVEAVLGRAGTPLPAADGKESPPCQIIDVGTGTGCIAISLALALPGAQVTAVDLSADALALARENAMAHGQETRVTFRQADLLEDAEPESVDVVVSNPPYIAEHEATKLSVEVLEHEPGLALFAGPDGLDVIRRLAAQALAALRPGGVLFLEIGETQGAAVRAILTDAGFTDIAIRKDLAGHDRMAQASKP